MELSVAFENEIHQRLLAGDVVAPPEVVDAYLEPLVNGLKRRFPSLSDPHLIDDAATDALLNYLEHPHRFDPEKGRLLGYLRLSAHRDLLNMLQKERRRRQREDRLRQHLRREPVELQTASGNRKRGDDTSPDPVQALKQRVFEAVTDPRDRHLLALILDGERKTAIYAEILGIQGQDREHQRRLVKRHKDRLKKRLVRLGAKLHERPSKP